MFGGMKTARKRPERKLSTRVEAGADLLLSGACRTVTAAAARCGLSREALSRAIHSPHGKAYMAAARATLPAAADSAPTKESTRC